MNKTGIPYLDFGWNPCGFGCSNNCDGCWARRMSGRMQCPDCKEFKVHFHPERLDQPARKKDPMAIGVQYTGELFDPKRSRMQISNAILACHFVPRHDYIFLTQQPKIMLELFEWFEGAYPNWYKGLTIKTQADADRDIPVLLKIPGKLWLSIEPMWENIILPRQAMEDDIGGVIVGCDNRKSVPFELDWARSIVEQCQAADVPVYVKQLRIDGILVHDPAKFPKDLRIRQLPWKLRTKKP